MSEHVLRADRLSVHYPGAGRPSPDDLDLALGPGERILVLGPSGCGKSSALLASAGVIPATIDADVYGDVRVCGVSSLDREVWQTATQCGYLGQDPLDQIVLSRVEDEVAFGLENARLDPDDITVRVEESLRATGAWHLAQRTTGSLSGGELQRVALAAVLARRTPLLLLDEPTAMLDPQSTSSILGLIGADQRATAQVLVEHRLDDMSVLPPRTLVLGPDGRTVLDAPTSEVLTEHAATVAQLGCWLPVGVEAALAVGRMPTVRDIDDPDGILSELAGTLPAPAGSGTAPGAPAVQARGLSIRAGRDRRSPTLVQDLDLTLRRGQVTAIVGANGSGKSTTLLGIAGLLPTSGRLSVTGRVGLVFQHPERQFLTRSVRDEIRYGLLGRADADERVDAELHRFELEGYDEANPFRLSGGQQRRLSIAAVVATDPEVLLLDEPTFGQDRRRAALLADLIRGLAVDGGAAVAIVTHDLAIAAAIADDIAVLSEGRLLAQRCPADLLADRALLDDAGLSTPPVIEWWRERGRPVPLRDLLLRLRSTTPAGGQR